MAKNVKKAKPVVKAPSKSASKEKAKPAKKQAKAPVAAAKKAKPSPKVEAAPKKVLAAAKKTDKKKVAEKSAPEKSSPEKAGSIKPVATTKPAGKAKSGSKADSKTKKAKKETEEFEDDLIDSDEDLGGEEIPDLSEFEDEGEEEADSSDSDVEILVEETFVAVQTSSPSSDEAVLTDAEGRPYCKVRDCDQIAAVDVYCRYHYLLLWKKIQVRRKILIDGKLERYVDELTARYPDKFLEMIKKDLRSEKDFLAAIAELEIDESGLDNDYEDDNQVLDEVRGFGAESGGSMSDDDEF